MSVELRSRIFYSLCFFKHYSTIDITKQQIHRLSMIFAVPDKDILDKIFEFTEKNHIKISFLSENRISMVITEQGMVEYDEIDHMLGSKVLEKTHYHIPETIDLSNLLSKLNDPFEKVLIVEMLLKERDLDISKILF